MKRIKEFLRVLLYPGLLLLAQYVSIFIFTFIFNISNTYEVGSNEYVESLAYFFSDYRVIIVILSVLLLIPLFKKKCNFNKLSTNKYSIMLLVLNGISFALVYNLTLLHLNKHLNFTNIFDSSNTNLFLALIASGIIGPIMEELIFRNIVYERFKKSYKPIIAIALTGLLFGLFHGNIIQFLYAFLLNFILIFVYEKFQSIYAPIVVHVSANCGLQLFLTFINYNNIYISSMFLIINIMILITSYKLLNLNTEKNE
ncbi:MAG: CPBP family intramembrane metalloprotease [Firmicutes bacterium]|nr:CPBP family intramembrane metalloprotease [Bacillota bacterium]